MEGDIRMSNKHCQHGTVLTRRCGACEKVTAVQERIKQEHAEMVKLLERMQREDAISGKVSVAAILDARAMLAKVRS